MTRFTIRIPPGKRPHLLGPINSDSDDVSDIPESGTSSRQYQDRLDRETDYEDLYADNEGYENDSDKENNEVTPQQVPLTQAPIKKRKLANKEAGSEGTVRTPEPSVAKTIMFIAAIASVGTKKQAKRIPKPGVEFSFTLDEPWDTLRAQILAKISVTLNPTTIDLDDYNVSFFIPRILPKPGLAHT